MDDIYRVLKFKFNKNTIFRLKKNITNNSQKNNKNKQSKNHFPNENVLLNMQSQISVLESSP